MSRRSPVRVDWRVGLTVAIGVTTSVVMVLLGMEPRLLLVVFVVAIVGAGTWLSVDLGSVVSPLVWTDHQGDTEKAPRSDGRVRALRMRLHTPVHRRRVPALINAGQAEPNDEIADTLISIVDDHLVAEFGVDRSLDPGAAAEILGPGLTTFVNDPSARRSMTGRRGLARTVALIEDLCSRTPRA